MLLPILLCVLCLPLSLPSFIIAYRDVFFSPQESANSLMSCLRLTKNKFLGSVFNITTTVMSVVVGKRHSTIQHLCYLEIYQEPWSQYPPRYQSA